MTVPPPEVPGGRRFELKRSIGSGAFGDVFLAEQVGGAGFRRMVALKLLRGSAAGADDAGRRMRDEARILGRLSHRHIVEVLDLVQLGDRWAVVMAYVPGADLEQVLDVVRPAAVPGPAACAVGGAVARALHGAWHATDDRGRQLKVVHRDIKPSNVRITADGEVKVLDFGVARVDMEGREAQTRRPGLIGTEAYMAPERLLLAGDVPAGDLYALASTVLELLRGTPLGRSPVRVDAHAAFVEAALGDLIGRLEGPREVVDEVVVLLRTGLDFDPARRPVPAVFAEVMDRAARKLDGLSLEAFCARVVPEAERRSDAGSQLVGGVLVEGGGPADPGSVDVDLHPTVGRWRRRRLVATGFLGAVSIALGLASWLGPPLPPVLLREPVVAVAEVAPVAPVVVPAVVAVVVPPEQVEARVPVATPAAPRRAPADLPPVPPAPPIEAVRVSRAMVVVADVGAIEVTCGDRTFRGSASVRVVDFPAGPCRVRVDVGGTWVSADVVIDAPREVACRASDGILVCR